MTERPLFIPLKREYFRAFENRTKTVEYRLYGPRWNERTCRTGRAVTLSLGYGKRHRLSGRITGFVATEMCYLGLDRSLYRELLRIFPSVTAATRVSCIGIAIEAAL